MLRQSVGACESGAGRGKFNEISSLPRRDILREQAEAEIATIRVRKSDNSNAA